MVAQARVDVRTCALTSSPAATTVSQETLWTAAETELSPLTNSSVWCRVPGLSSRAAVDRSYVGAPRYTTPSASIASATLLNPAMFAPTT